MTLQDMTPLEELERLRAEFLGMVSHELRTPLTSIKGSAAILMDDSSDLDPAEMAQFFRIIDNQADHMRDLISDLLDVARTETGTLPVDPEPSRVAVLVDEARIRFQSGLRAHRDRRPGGCPPPDGGGKAPSGAAGHVAAGQRRHGTDAGHTGDDERARHLPVGVRPG